MLERSGVRWLLHLLPALAAIAIILWFAHDVPYGDEWDTPGKLLERIEKDSVRWQDYFEQHNESRKAFPRLIFAATSRALGWHVKLHMVLSWFCVLATFLLVRRMLAGGGENDSLWTFVVVLLAGLLLFSPIQAQNQLWGIQLVVFIPPLCLAASLWIQTTAIAYREVVLVCAGLSLVATFSFANGMLCWILAFPYLRQPVSVPGRSARTESVALWRLLYLALALVSLTFYFWDYRRPSRHPSFDVVLKDPAAGLDFFVTWLGAPLAGVSGGRTEAVARLVGSGILLTLCVVLAWIAREASCGSPRRLLAPSHPWFCCAAYGILSGLLTTAGRAGFGREHALSQRYSTFALWVAIGVVGLAWVLWNAQEGRRFNSARAVSLAVVVGILCSTTWSWKAGLDRAEELARRGGQHALTLRLLNVAPANPLIGCRRADCLHPSRELVLRRAAALSDAGVLKVDFVGPWLVEKVNAPDGGGGGEYRIESEAEGIRVLGRATLPGERRLPDCVVLTRPGHTGDLLVVSGLTVESGSRHDSMPAVGRGRDGGLFHQWLGIPDAEGPGLRMFAVDLKDRRVYGMSRAEMETEASGRGLPRRG